MRTKILCIILFLSAYSAGWSQDIIAGSGEAQKRREWQLNGQFDSSISFAVQPFIFGTSDSSNEKGKTLFNSRHTQFRLLPFRLIQQFNSHHPFGWNDGAMIPANGYQILASAGFYGKLGPFSIQLQPEMVYAANAKYPTTVDYGSTNFPSFQKIYPGQSNIKLSLLGMEAGFSTQNLWWGPGQYSSLLMSNNAPGMLHGFWRSSRPNKTPIGSFEWQLIGAKMTANNRYGYENFDLRNPLYSGSRYLSAFVISYHPKWIPGLFVGMTRAIQRYRADINKSGSSFIDRYFPVLTKAVEKQNAIFDDTMRTDQLASFFLRWVLPKAKTEFYVEYGFNDYNQNTRDYLMGPTHSAAYLIGAKKIVDLAPETYLDLNFEMTQMSQTPEYIVRDAGNWYVHSQIVEGYTNENQIIGAGAGLGCNVQTLAASWVKGVKRFGVMFERVERDPQYHTYKWTDFGLGFLPQWQYRNMLLSGKIMFINSSQYAWQKDVNRFNLHSRLIFQYSF